MYYHRGGNSANKSHETEKLPNICVVGGCSNVTNTEKGISLHFIPYTGGEMHEAKRRRVDFVHLKRAMRSNVQHTLRRYSLLVRPRLATDEIGFVAIPKYTNTVDDKPLSARAKRMVYV